MEDLKTTYAPRFSHEDVQIEGEVVAYDGFFNLSKYRIRHRLFEGGWSVPVERECAHRRPAVGVLLYDPVRDAVVMVEQFRVGALARAGSPWLLELVAGIIEPGEAPQSVARRESQEEAGALIQEMEKICEYLPSPGGNSERMTLYCGQVDSMGLGGVHGLDEEHEDICVHVLDRQSLWAQLLAGVTDNAASMIALQWLQLNYERLKREWALRPDE